MDRSVFGSAIKTYPSKNSRTSRYYRPSSCILQQTNVFEDDEPADLFDKLINEEKVRQSYNDFSSTLPNKTSSNFGNVTNRKSLFYPTEPAVLQSLQNLDVDVKRSSRTSTLATLNKNKANRRKEGKENRCKYSQLFLSDEDTANDLSSNQLEIYEFNPDTSAQVGRKLKKKTIRKSAKPYAVHRKREKVKRLQDYRVKKFGELRPSGIRSHDATNTSFKISEMGASNCDLSGIKFSDFINRDFSDFSTFQNRKSNYFQQSAVERSSSEFLFKPLLKKLPLSNARKLSFLGTRSKVKRSTSDDSNELSCCDKHRNSADSEPRSSDYNAVRTDRASSPVRFSVAIAQLDHRKSYLFDPAVMSTPERRLSSMSARSRSDSSITSPDENDGRFSSCPQNRIADRDSSPVRFSVAIAQLDRRKSYMFDPEIMSTPERKLPGVSSRSRLDPSLASPDEDNGRFSSCRQSENAGTNDSGMPVIMVDKNVETHVTETSHLQVEMSFSLATCEDGEYSSDSLPKSVEGETVHSIPEDATNKEYATASESVELENDRSHPEETSADDTSIEHENVRIHEMNSFVDGRSAGHEENQSCLIEEPVNYLEFGHVSESLDSLANHAQNSFRVVVDSGSISHSSVDLTYRQYELDRPTDTGSLNCDTNHLSSSSGSIDFDSSQSSRISIATASLSESPRARSTFTQLSRVSTTEIEHLADDVSHLHVSDQAMIYSVEESREETMVQKVSMYPNPSSDESKFLGFNSPHLRQAELSKQILLSNFQSLPLRPAPDSDSSSNSERFVTVVHLESSTLDESAPLCSSVESYVPGKTTDFDRSSEDTFISTGNQATTIGHHESATESGCSGGNALLLADDVDLTNVSSASDDSLARTVVSKDAANITVVCSQQLSPTAEASVSKPGTSLDCILEDSILQRFVDFGNISPIYNAKKLPLCRRSAGRVEAVAPTVVTCRPHTFEPLVEENEEETEDEYPRKFESTRAAEVTPSAHHLNFVNVTARRRRQNTLPTLNEVATEEDVGCETMVSSFLCRSSFSRSTFRQSFVLKKGKKWRRSFITLKNIREYGLNAEVADEENKGRMWRKNVEELIGDQSDARIICQELEECSMLRTGFDDGTAVADSKEGDTVVSVTAKCGRAEKARFSLCLSSAAAAAATAAAASASAAGAGNSSNDSSEAEEPTWSASSSWSSYSRIANNANENAVRDVDSSCASFLIDELRESLVGSHENRAGDYSRILGFPSIDASIVDSAKDIVLHYCQQREPLPFEACFSDSMLQKCEKIGEGVYGEVFRLKKRSHCSVLKIIPIEGDQLVNGERQKKFDEILSELVISVQLSHLRKRKDFYTECFAEVLQCWCVYGRYPKRLLTLWKKYDLDKGSDNDSPKMFKDDQLYLILEQNDGGKDVESFKFRNPQESLSVFTQVSNALAVAESAFKFEHRDLHWGNILVTRVTPKDAETRFIINGENRYFRLEGVKVTIIDYTLSRISISNRTLYNNIGLDPELFTAEGDFQFEVYRLMRKEVNNTWDQFVPKTNILWLFYLVDKLISEAQYSRYSKRKFEPYFERLHEWYKVTMQYDSSSQLAEELCALGWW